VREVGKSIVEYTVQLKATFNPKLTANNVVVKIPTPLNTTKVDCKVQMGKAKYVPAENHIVWKYVSNLSFFLFGSNPGS
jgi:AP-2 complex subunit mu-1